MNTRWSRFFNSDVAFYSFLGLWIIGLAPAVAWQNGSARWRWAFAIIGTLLFLAYQSGSNYYRLRAFKAYLGGKG